MQVIWKCIIALAPLMLGGCLLNDAHEIRGRLGKIPNNRAVIILGVSDDRFADGLSTSRLQLDAYSFATQSITGNCARYTRLEATLKAPTDKARYFAFDAPAGYYTISPFLQVSASASTYGEAFEARPNVVTYLGDFIETGGEAPYWRGKVERRDDLASATEFARARGLPAPELAASKPLDVPPRLFVCTP